MADPSTATSFSIAALAIAVLGPMAGPYALIVFAALAGALWPLSTMGTVTRSQGASFLLRVVATAVVLTGGVAAWLESEYNVNAANSLAVAAFGIGAMGNGWRPLLGALRNLALTLVQRASGQNAGQQPPTGGGPQP